jgi:hypothetical protein
MTAMQVAGAASRCKARWQQMSIVKVGLKSPTGFCQGPLEMLELLEGKPSRAVLRGLGGSNPTWLPGERSREAPDLPGDDRKNCLSERMTENRMSEHSGDLP